MHHPPAHALNRSILALLTIALCVSALLGLPAFAHPAPNHLLEVQAVIDSSVAVQVIEVLVSNAVMYSPLGKNIYVRLLQPAAAIRCEVRDEGLQLSGCARAVLNGIGHGFHARLEWERIIL